MLSSRRSSAVAVEWWRVAWLREARSPVETSGVAMPTEPAQARPPVPVPMGSSPQELMCRARVRTMHPQVGWRPLLIRRRSAPR